MQMIFNMWAMIFQHIEYSMKFPLFNGMDNSIIAPQQKLLISKITHSINKLM